MAACQKRTTNKWPATARIVDNVELAELVKLAVAEAIKEAIPTLVEDVLSQLTNTTQALVDAQVAVFHGEMIAMQADNSKCMDYMEKDENCIVEVDKQLSSSVSKLAAKHVQLENKIADMEDRSRRDNLCVHGVPENEETLNVLALLLGVIPRWFPNLASVEIMRAHRAPKDDTNGRPVHRTILAFSEAMDALQKLDFHTFLLYPAKLKAM